MRPAGRKSGKQGSNKSYISKKKVGLKPLNGSETRIPYNKRHVTKLRVHLKTDDSIFSMTVADYLNNRSVNVSDMKKSTGRRTLAKTGRVKFFKKKPASNLKGDGLIYPKSKEPTENVSKVKFQKMKKKRTRRRQKHMVEMDDASRLQRRTRYLLIRMKLEQNLIDAYSTEGWKGQSREKIRPVKELVRANKQILKCKLAIRDAIHQLESLSSVGCIEDSVIAPDGSVHHEHIICAKCSLREAFPDNDIILCDGTCNSAFHQKCLDPPLATESIPPGEQGWFCKYCVCKMEILETMNAHLGTCYSPDSSWQDIFKDEATLPGGEDALNPEQEWPSDDSQDDDYDPERNEYDCSVSREDAEESSFNNASISDRLSWSFEDDLCSESEWLEKKGPEPNINSDGTTNQEIIVGRRERRAVDYKKLYYEMFGKDPFVNEQVSEDEDWGPTKRKRRERDSDAVNTLMTLCENEDKGPDMGSIRNETHSDQQAKRSFFRIPPSAVEKLREVFAENKLPSRALRQSLSDQLGLDLEKVSKWFKNARHISLKTQKVDVLFGENVSLKDQMQLPKARREEYRREDAEAEMQRLCWIQGKVEKMKKVLQQLPLGKTKKPKENKLHRQSVIFVPVAELREKG